jgi:lysozyme family protein
VGTRPIQVHDAGERAFEAASAFVIDILEGGAKVITDSGGVTRWGISKRAYPHLDIAVLTRTVAEDIYRRDYWNKIKGDLMQPAALALLVFSCAVNMSPARATSILQRALGVTDDGIIGPETLIAAQGFHPQSELRARFNELWLRTYVELVRSRPVYQQYLHGWAMRVFRCADEAGRWAESFPLTARVSSERQA